MIKSVFQITDCETYPEWGKTQDGREAPVKKLMLKDIVKDAPIEEIRCDVFGTDATARYELGELVLATVRIYVTMNEDEEFIQVIQARDIKKINLPKDN